MNLGWSTATFSQLNLKTTLLSSMNNEVWQCKTFARIVSVPCKVCCEKPFVNLRIMVVVDQQWVGGDLVLVEDWREGWWWTIWWLQVSTLETRGQRQCPAGRVFQYRVGSGRVLNKIPGSGSGSGRVRVSKNTIGYFRVSFFLSGISGYFGYFRVCRVFSGISGFTHIY